jgi:hypothetical protein
MKVRLTFKMPDVIDQATEGEDEDKADEIKAACKKWVSDGEYLSVEIDTETGTCTALPAN